MSDLDVNSLIIRRLEVVGAVAGSR